MRKGLIALLVALLVGVPAFLLTPPSTASPEDQYTGTHFGADNLPPGCIKSMSLTDPANVCYHMRTGMNGLDTPQVDVLVMVPVSPTAERDMRVMRQAVEMWEGGIDYLADQMHLGWMKGVDFHITLDYVDLTGQGNGGEFTTYPVVDPEIVIIASNPVGGIGIGIDPVSNVFGPDFMPCTGLANPFDFDAWDALPGFDRHHEERTGTYVAKCTQADGKTEGTGGNVCFAVNGAIDPEPGTIDFFNLFDLVSHEFGHCLTIGHVGDGAEGSWGVLPSNDIMAYSQDPPGGTKCVSTLDVEGIATTMSKYLDVNGDGGVTEADRVLANDQQGDGSNPFQVQHPRDHFYASATGSPLDCPQPDLGPVPGPRTAWTPTPTASYDPVLTVASPDDGATTDAAGVHVAGQLERRTIGGDPVPTSPTGTVDDADDDATTPQTEILSSDVAVTADDVVTTLHLADLWPTTAVTSPVSYSTIIDGRQLDTFVRYPGVDDNPLTFDSAGGGYVPAESGGSTWDTTTKTVQIRISRDYLEKAGITAPYQVVTTANLGSIPETVPDDRAPDGRASIGVAAPSAALAPIPLAQRSTETRTFEHEGGNTFTTADSSLGNQLILVETGAPHTYTLDLPVASDVTFTLGWTGADTGNDLDLTVTGAADSGSTGATSSQPEVVHLSGAKGHLDVKVDPYLIADAANGATYTLTADITPLEAGPTDPDSDGDGVADSIDACPTQAGAGNDGCPIAAIEHVLVYVDGALAGTQDVDTANGPDGFDLPVTLSVGTHQLRTEWERRGKVLATDERTITRRAAVADGDHDGVADASDNCATTANADQADLDHDGIGDACDPDIDGDGYSNADETRAGTNPYDATSTPKKKGGKGGGGKGPKGGAIAF
jgi:hypothetical protein